MLASETLLYFNELGLRANSDDCSSPRLSQMHPRIPSLSNMNGEQTQILPGYTGIAQSNWTRPMDVAWSYPLVPTVER